MVIASMKPGIASCLIVTSPVAAFVEMTFPRSLYTLYEESAVDSEVPGCCRWQPVAIVIVITATTSNLRITPQFTTAEQGETPLVCVAYTFPVSHRDGQRRTSV